MPSALFKNLFPDIERTISPHCPWYEHQEIYGMPNIKYCEQTICSYINEPAHAISNIGYIIVAFLIFWHTNKYGYRKVIWMAPAIVLVALTSFYYHSTNNALSQFFDYLGMYSILSLLACFNLSRGKILKFSQTVIPFIGLMCASIGLFFLFAKFQIKVQLTVVVIALIVALLEFWIKTKKHQLISYKNLYLGLAGFAAAKILDTILMQEAFCDPTNHFLQGHALWHVLGSISFWFIYKFYIQVEKQMLD